MTAVPLYRLTRQGMLLVDADFLRGQPARLPDDPNYAVPVPGDATATTLPVFDLPDEGPLGAQHDPPVALALHRQLAIHRGVAADPRMWAWLATRHYADLLRRRWSAGDRTPNPIRFVGSLDDHGLARLWWAAELTRETGTPQRHHEAALRSLLSSQYRTDRILGMPVLRHAPVVLGILDALGDDTRWQLLNEVCRRLGLMATTYAVAAMRRDEVAALVGRLVGEIGAG